MIDIIEGRRFAPVEQGTDRSTGAVRQVQDVAIDQLKGRAAARRLSRESAATFPREVPPFLERLAGQWRAMN